MHPAQLPDELLIADCEFRHDRRGGPGGQHRNKVETAVVAVHRPTGITAEANERRSQADNKRNVLFRLRLNLAMQVRQPTAPGEVPSELWSSRRRGNRIQVSATHRDFPALLAEVFDYLSACEYSIADAAQHFAVSTSQLVKLLRSFPPALAALNAQRVARGLHKMT